MNQVPIDLSESFEKVLATALSLPRTDDAWPSDGAIKQAMRSLYEVANGRIVETHIGAIPIAPPAKPWLKAKPLCLKSAADLLTMVKDSLGASDSQITPGRNLKSAVSPKLAPRCSNSWPEDWGHRNAGQTKETTLPILMAPRVPSHAPSAGGKTKAEKRYPHVNQLFTANNTAINPNKMTNPPIHITPHNLALSPALQQFIRRKMSALSRFAGDMLAAEIILRGKSDAPHLFSLSARLALPGRDIQGNAVHENLYTAIDQLIAKLARLSRKRKTRLAKKFKRARRPPAVDSKGRSP